MRPQIQTTAVFAVLAAIPVVISVQQSRPWGIVGYGIDMLKPSCAFACRQILAQSPLNCSTPPTADRHQTGGKLTFETSLECFASNDPFLLSLAWCVANHCRTPVPIAPVEEWVLYWFWEHEVVPDELELKYTFNEALAKCGDDGLKRVHTSGELLDSPGIVNESEWAVSESTMRWITNTEENHSVYAISLLLTMVFLPLLLCSLGSIISNFPRLERIFLVHLIHPTIFRHHPFLNRLVGEPQPPTRAEAILVVLVICANTVFSLAGFPGPLPGNLLASQVIVIAVILANRTGIMACVNFAIIILYAARSNPLIHLTGWPYRTFLLLHRWIAYIAIFQAMIHSAIFVALRFQFLNYEFTQMYWIMGTIGTLAMCIIFLLSLPSIRRTWYEFFLDSHVLLVICVFLTTYYHIYLRYLHSRGYENWIYLAATLWAAERLVRLTTIISNGIKTGYVVEKDDEYFLIDIPGAKGIGMSYLYFPSTHWRFWENHPFSIMASVVRLRHKSTVKIIQHDELDISSTEENMNNILGEEDDEIHWIQPTRQKHFIPRQHKNSAQIPLLTSIPDSLPQRLELNETEDEFKHSKEMVTGLSFLIRREKGLTAKLFTTTSRMRVLLEGPYPSHMPFSDLVATVPHLVFVAGGVGIAPILPIVRSRTNSSALGVRTALYFGTKSPALVNIHDLAALRHHSSGVDIRVRVQERWDLEAVVIDEANRYSADKNIGMVVVVCGPGSMVEAVRWAVVSVNASYMRAKPVRFIEESYQGW